MPVMLGFEPEPTRLIAALRIIADRARRCREELAAIPDDSAPLETAMEALGVVQRHADGCADDLETLAQEHTSQQRVDDESPPPG